MQSGFIDTDGAKVKDASALVATDTLDYISIMTYEMGHHYREDTGIHAPLRSGDATPKDQTWSIEKSVKVWKDAKVPLDRIQIGLPAYGKVFTTSLTRGEALPPRQEYGGSLLYQPTNFLRDQKKLAGGEKGQIDASLYDKDPDCPETLRLKAKVLTVRWPFHAIFEKALLIQTVCSMVKLSRRVCRSLKRVVLRLASSITGMIPAHLLTFITRKRQSL